MDLVEFGSFCIIRVAVRCVIRAGCCRLCSCAVGIGLVDDLYWLMNWLLTSGDSNCMGSWSEIDWWNDDFVGKMLNLVENRKIAVV